MSLCHSNLFRKLRLTIAKLEIEKYLTSTFTLLSTHFLPKLKSSI
jgi:hypothetical protein